MSDIILKAENISKQYRLGLIGTGTLSHDLNRWWHLIRGKEDPYLKVGAVNKRSEKASQEYVWALKDINFEVKKGEVLGIIGKNGAGKSTLLKILSRVTSPTTGSIKTKGRIASLLEVGTGFHPELTGRENIYLNGAILGMNKAEISTKIDEIVAFSGCEMYIDTPTKRYSSGMTVRLAFAVAAFLEPDILVVDEVLAVGDAEFQKKAIGKMQDISSGDGRTVLFVSHNMASVQSLCTRGMILENGYVSFSGNIEECVDKYINSSSQTFSRVDLASRDGIEVLDVYIKDFQLLNQESKPVETVTISQPVGFQFVIPSKREIDITSRITIFDSFDQRLLVFDSDHSNDRFYLKPGENVVEASLPAGLELKPGNYYINISIRHTNEYLDSYIRVLEFEIQEEDYFNSKKPISGNLPLVLKKSNWKLS
ncbi:ABC transporter ATP-binding protein [Nonlabens ponticola]|uniref:ABC transporter ATP-binding protein n=1 Tax=Nonlabens ponticola TaxID=2496866 RepID=A0A3S9MXJ5_9FLAO|nr:ABC transporter ATP-binding protein [Nonlabens ponticola]AZQ43864.1 ABC transporter ATP-binding protein [Nonlabens ponticola]